MTQPSYETVCNETVLFAFYLQCVLVSVLLVSPLPARCPTCKWLANRHLVRGARAQRRGRCLRVRIMHERARARAGHEHARRRSTLLMSARAAQRLCTHRAAHGQEWWWSSGERFAYAHFHATLN